MRVSQEAFADLCGLDRTYIGGIERGERNVALVNLEKIAKALNDDPRIPVTIVFKPVLKAPEEILHLCQEASKDKKCVGVIAWMHTFSPARMWIGGLKVLHEDPLSPMPVKLVYDGAQVDIKCDLVTLYDIWEGDFTLTLSTAPASIHETVGTAYAICDAFAIDREKISKSNMPTMCNKTYQYHHDIIFDTLHDAAQKSMEDAIAEEIEHAVQMGNVGADGIPELTVTCDGSWARRSYHSHYNSLAGMVIFLIILRVRGRGLHVVF